MMTHASFPTAVAAAALALSSGCFWVTTQHEGEKLREDIERVEAQVEEQQETLGSRVNRLQEVLDEATELLARNSADLGADVNQLVEEQARLNGLVMEASREVAELRNQLSVLGSQHEDLQERLVLLEEDIEERDIDDPEELFELGREAFQDGDYEYATELFRYLVVQFPDYERADEGQYHRGESHFRLENYESALGEFQRVYENYPESDIADDALYRAGETAFELGWCRDARAYLSLMREDYPDSGLLERAESLEAEIRQAEDTPRCES